MKADQLSLTAAFLAVKFYGLNRIKKFSSLFDDSVIRFYDQLVQTLPSPIRYYHFWLKFGWVRKLCIWSEELLLPGDLLHVVARKWLIQKMTQQLRDEGYKQLIVLGAGFDHLAFYFADQGLASFEFDAPHMAKRKRRFLKDWYPNRTHPVIIPAHLPADKISSLFSEHPDLDPHKKTIIVAEGFWDYLPPKTVSLSIRQACSYFSHKPALISTHFSLDELPKFHRWVFENSVQMVGEKLQFSTSVNGFEQLLNEGGFDIRQLFDSQEISEKLNHCFNTDLAMLQGFYILLAK